MAVFNDSEKTAEVMAVLKGCDQRLPKWWLSSKTDPKKNGWKMLKWWLSCGARLPNNSWRRILQMEISKKKSAKVVFLLKNPLKSIFFSWAQGPHLRFDNPGVTPCWSDDVDVLWHFCSEFCLGVFCWIQSCRMRLLFDLTCELQLW